MATALRSRTKASAGVQTQTRDRAASVPWYIWSLYASGISVLIGGYWDISWHMSVGRDSFWTPAHMAIQLCGVLAGLTCGYLIFSSTLD